MMGDIPTSFQGLSLLTLVKEVQEYHISDNCEIRHRPDGESLSLLARSFNSSRINLIFDYNRVQFLPMILGCVFSYWEKYSSRTCNLSIT